MQGKRRAAGWLALAAAVLLGASEPQPAAEPAPSEGAPAPSEAEGPSDPEEQFQLAARYLVGRDGVAKDPSQAVVWFRRAAEQGHRRAQAQLGMAYYRGRGTPVDLREALHWLNVAAEGGHPRAQLQLGIAHRDGVGVAKDATRSLMWFRIAAQSGSIPASMMLGGVSANMTPEQRREAHLMAAEWRREHGQASPHGAPEPDDAAATEASPEAGAGEAAAPGAGEAP